MGSPAGARSRGTCARSLGTGWRIDVSAYACMTCGLAFASKKGLVRNPGDATFVFAVAAACRLAKPLLSRNQSIQVLKGIR